MTRAAVKFCGLTRPEDAALAGALGAAFAGAVFAGGPRVVSAKQAARVLDAAGPSVRRVGVFGDQPPDIIAAAARAARLDVVQLHADPSVEQIEAVRRATGCAVWAALRIAGGALPLSRSELWAAADAVVLDSRVPDRLGGSGTPFDWSAVAPTLRVERGPARVVLAGGLTPDTVAAGIALLAPDVVDVSSGVESAPGVKDPARMRAFVDAVRGAGA